jgi:hypothetical protein
MKRKKFIIIGGVFLALVIAAGIALTIVRYNQRIDSLNEDIDSLQAQLEEYQASTTTVLQVVKNVKSGNAVESYEVDEVEVPTDAVPENVITDYADLEGKSYKINLKAYTYLTKNMLIEEELTDGMRKLDVVLTEIPIGLEEGDYIDVRICFPLGQDYIAMTHKQVLEINGDTVKIIAEQEDIYTYESMGTDYSTYPSTKVYAVSYVEAGIQEAASNYYPVTLEVLKTRILDPNIDTGDFSATLQRREQLERQLADSDKVDINQTVTGTRENLVSIFNQAKQDYEQLQEEKEKQAEQEAAAAAAAAAAAEEEGGSEE